MFLNLISHCSLTCAKTTFSCRINAQLHLQAHPRAAQVRSSRPARGAELSLPTRRLLLHRSQPNRHQESSAHTQWREIVHLYTAGLRLSRTNNGTIEKVTRRESADDPRTISRLFAQYLVELHKVLRTFDFNWIYQRWNFFFCYMSIEFTLITLIDQKVFLIFAMSH